jgi:hypothetical protein
MTTATAAEDHRRYIRQVYKENYARLRRYFLCQAEDPSEADACVRKTVRLFFASAEGRRRDTSTEYVPARLMRIAWRLRMGKLDGEGPHHARRGLARQDREGAVYSIAGYPRSGHLVCLLYVEGDALRGGGLRGVVVNFEFKLVAARR